MVSPCPFRRQDTLTGVLYCARAAMDSQTAFLAGNGQRDACWDCPVPSLLEQCRCRWLELMTVIMSRPDRHRVVEVKIYCRNDDVRLDDLDECTPEKCRAFEPRGGTVPGT